MASIKELRLERIKKADQLKEKGIDPYPSKSFRTNYIGEVVDNFSEHEGKSHVLSGRIMSIREHGSLRFMDVEDSSGRIQVYIKDETLSPTDVEEQHVGFYDLPLLDIGDLIDVEGEIIKTKRGQISIDAKNIRILTKSIRPLPDKKDGLKDPELKVRKRYLDLIMNPEKKEAFKKTAELTFAIRKFLNNKGFLEIKTPILQPIYGGGTAKPFVTKVNMLDSDFYLAISHELYLKRLITAGFENVYNITGYFRNEGIDRTHNPEFSMLETMSAYKNYEDNMDLIEEMYSFITKEVFGTQEFEIMGAKVDFGKPWKRISMNDAVIEHTSINFNSFKELKEAHDALAKLGINERPESIGESMVLAFEEKVEEKLIEPTFVMHHPVEISPLAKTLDSDRRFVERFEIFIGGVEGGDNWSELNDPVELFERFKDQARRKKGGDEEAHPMDIDFIEMMEHGMPPTTGLGPGIERLAMMLTGSKHIDDVIFFPMLRPRPLDDTDREIYDL